MSDPFKKYRYPETNFGVLSTLLGEFGFKQRFDDEENLYFIKNDKRVTVPKETRIFGITIYDIVNQSGISDDDFRRRLDELNTMTK